jgi:hypothetical protein
VENVKYIGDDKLRMEKIIHGKLVLRLLLWQICLLLKRCCVANLLKTLFFSAQKASEIKLNHTIVGARAQFQMGGQKGGKKVFFLHRNCPRIEKVSGTT